MIRPVWHFELARDTDAPIALVRQALLDGQGYHLWHPRHRAAEPEVIEDGARFEVRCRARGLGVCEDGWYRAEPLEGGRLLLTYRARFKGWPVILLMGWWRIKSEHIWERFIASLA